MVDEGFVDGVRSPGLQFGEIADAEDAIASHRNRFGEREARIHRDDPAGGIDDGFVHDCPCALDRLWDYYQVNW
jgi:hypothetical protein